MGQHNDNDNDNNYLKYFKVIIVGNPATGKTSIMEKFMCNKFDSNYKKSITPISYNKKYTVNDIDYSFDVFDIPGDKNLNMIKTFSNGANGIIYCCRCDDEQSKSDLLTFWKDNLNPDEKIPIILIENMCDLLGEKENYYNDRKSLKKTANLLGCSYFFRTSALNGYEITDSLETLFNKIIKNFKEELIEENNKIESEEKGCCHSCYHY